MDVRCDVHDQPAVYWSNTTFFTWSVLIYRPLVYAAELVCLLIGAKGVVMLQYDTPSEHQWKFPAVH